MLKKIALQFGFTTTELKAILFLSALLFLGLTVSYIKELNRFDEKFFDYSIQDSLFASSDSANAFSRNSLKSVLNKEETGPSGIKPKEKTPLREKSVNVNKAGVNELQRLPGIGEKTAEKIIELRSKKGKFDKIEDLLKVKGIGKAKFDKLKIFIYVE